MILASPALHIWSMLIFWTFNLGTHCKPLQQQSNDRLSDDDILITNVYDADQLNEMPLADSDVSIQKLTRTMDALAQFKEMLNNRLVSGASQIDQDSDLERRSYVAEQRTSAPHHGRSKSHKRKHHKPTSTTSAPSTPNRQYQREQRSQDTADLQSNTFQMHGFQIKARLQPDPAPSSNNDQHRPVDQTPDQRYMTGRTTAMDEQQLRVLSDLPNSDFECPRLHGKATQVLCPSRRRHGYRVCIPDTALCNDRIDCPNGEDEDPINCLFYKTTIHHFRLVVDAVVELSDLVKQQERRRNLDEL